MACCQCLVRPRLGLGRKGNITSIICSSFEDSISPRLIDWPGMRIERCTRCLLTLSSSLQKHLGQTRHSKSPDKPILRPLPKLPSKLTHVLGHLHNSHTT